MDDTTPQGFSSLGYQPDANADDAKSRSQVANTSDASAQVFNVDDAVRMRSVKQGPAVRQVSTALPQEAKVREARTPSAASIPIHELIGSHPGIPPVPPRHDQNRPSKGHHRYHSLGRDTAPEAHQAHAQPQTQAQGYVHSLEHTRSRPASQPAPQAPHAPHAHSRQRVHVRSDSRTRPLPTPVSKSQPQPHSHARAHSTSEALPHSRAQSKSYSDKSGPDEAPRKRNFTKKSITNLIATAPADHVYDLDEIDLPGPERRLLEKFVNSLSKLSIEIQMDEGKREEGRRRLNNALRALEGWI